MCLDVKQNVSEELYISVSDTEELGSLNHQSGKVTSLREAPLTGQPVWQMDEVQQQSSFTASLNSISTDEEEEEAENLRPGRDGGKSEGEKLKEEDVRTVGHDYECVTITASLADELDKADEDLVLSQSLNGSVPLGAQLELSVPRQNELFDPQALQTVVSGCEMPDQRTSLESSQVVKTEIG